MKRTTQEQRERLTKEEAQLRAEAVKNQRRVNAIQAELLRLVFVELIGKPGAVKMRWRERPGDRCFHLNDLRGTVTAVGRTEAVVDFGTAGASKASMSGKWVLSFDCLLPTEGDKPQDEVLFEMRDGTP